MKRFKHWIEYAAIRGIEIVFQLLPRRWAFAIGEALGIGLSHLLPKRQRLILDNLAHAFPEKSETERQRIARRVWLNIGRTAAEFVRLPELSQGNVEDLVVFENADRVKALRDEGRGLILLTAHFANWEVTGVGCQVTLRDVTAIARPIKNPYVDRWILDKRRASGMKIILHREAVRACLKALKQKKTVGMLVDQNLYTGGVFVNFFGRPAATTTLPALLHIRTGAPVVMAYTVREGDRFRVIFEPPIVFPTIADEEQRVLAYTKTINEHLERLVRRAPENWFWIHNRWKRKAETPPVIGATA